MKHNPHKPVPNECPNPAARVFCRPDAVVNAYMDMNFNRDSYLMTTLTHKSNILATYCLVARTCCLLAAPVRNPLPCAGLP